MNYKLILELASEMLNQTSIDYSYHGCTDLNKKIIDIIPQSLCDEMRICNSNGSDTYPKSPKFIDEVSLMSFLSDKLKSMAIELDREYKINQIIKYAQYH